ncbi:MAG: TlpA disulfide reductase family protein [Gammaproteobacteria bacterium]|nr:TlpA disulfide reductase family protein [Gammaproteobacteria bacterium]
MNRFVLMSILMAWSLASAAVDMPLKGLDGKESNLLDYRGKWLVVNYWATWCPPCIEEMPELQAFHDEHAETKAVVLGINTEVMDSELIQAFLDDYFITYPNFTNGPVSQTPMGSVPGLPTTFLISPEGKAEARQVGAVTREMIENFIQKWEANNQSK